VELIVRFKDVKFTYPDGTALYFVGEELTVRRGERVALLGQNGSGKTTLFQHLLGLVRPESGLVEVFGRDPYRDFEKIRPRIGFLFQDPDRQIVAPTVRDDIGFGPRNQGLPAAEVDRLVRAVAADLRIEHLLDRLAHYLSGGEKMKVALAGALVMRPELLLLDEPFEGLDAASRVELVELLNRLNRERGISFIISVHEVSLAPLFIDTIYVLTRGGRFVAKGSPREIFSRPELLIEHRLEPPVVGLICQQLRARGFDVPIALTPGEAVEALAKLLSGVPASGTERPVGDV
jgi:cobalt/nickel transport system ATP-binding protein